MRVRKDIPRLRTARLWRAVRRALAGGRAKVGFRICEFSVQSNHVHLICEASHHEALARGMQGFGIRFAKQVNRALGGRRGGVLRERYATTLLKVPRQVRNCLCYVLHNARRHGATLVGADEFSSARTFTGWRDYCGLPPPPADEPTPVTTARTKLLQSRWRFHGLIGPQETH